MQTNGIKPSIFYKEQIRRILGVVNEEALELERKLIDKTPASDGRLRQGWTTITARQDNPKATVGQSVNYFLPVEFGRKPGSGISKKGQVAVAKWAKRNLGLPDKTRDGGTTAKTFAFLLSRKYKLEGRPATGFAGLAKEGAQAPSSIPDKIEPLSGGLIAASFNKLKARLNEI